MRRSKLCWLIADDKGGGIVSVAVSCARQAAALGHTASILLLTRSTGWLAREPLDKVNVYSLACEPDAPDAPVRIAEWLQMNPQEFLLINGVGEFDDAIRYVAKKTRTIYVVHDSARQYWRAAVRWERYLDGIAAVSETVAVEFRQKLARPEILQVLWNGSYFPLIPMDCDKRPPNLLFCGGESSRKGASDVIKLWRHLVAERFSGELHWFGDIGPEFLAKIKKLPCVNRIHLYGRCPREQIFQKAVSCRVFLMLSRVEPFGMVTVEAMCMGCVPVAWDIAAGTKEIVPRDASFVPLGNIKFLTRAVMKALEAGPKVREAMATHARNKFSEAAMWARYWAALEQWDLTSIAQRTDGGSRPRLYRKRIRLYQLFPDSWRNAMRELVGSSPRLGHFLRNKRGL